MVALEFQAVVLAGGRGTRLPELTGERPKCLLPIGPFPLLWYPLQMLQKNGFQDVIVVVQETQKSEIQQSLEKTPLKLKIDYATIPSDLDFGTADSLKHIQDKLKTDLVVVSCDTITNASLFPLLNLFRQHDASVATLLIKGGAESDAVVPGPKTKHKPERDLIGIHPETQRLLFLSSTSDFEETMSLPGHLLRKNQQICIHSRLVDSHIYVIKKWVIDFLSKSEGFSTIKGELLPYIVKKQMSRPPINISGEHHDKPFSVVNVNVKIDDIFNFVSCSELETKINETTLFNDTQNKAAYNSDLIRCYAMQTTGDIFGLRVNTTLGYCAANQKIFTYWEKLFGESNAPPLVAATSVINSTQMQQCAVADNTTISEKTSLKNCVLGSNCQVNPKTRISDTVLMTGVVVEEGVVIENSIICDKAIIRKGSVVKHCLIGSNFEVVENSKIEKVHLTNADGFMEIE